MFYARTIGRLFVLLAAIGFASGWMSGESAAGDENWLVSGDDIWVIASVSGGATVTDPSGETIVARPDVGLPAGARIKTDGNGQVVLGRGKSVAVVRRDSDVEVRGELDDGRISLFQRFGGLLLEVEPLGYWHFEVETPHLTAVVKGTQFTVAVAPTGSSVLVKEGAVEVMSLVTGQATLIGPGQTARVATDLSDRQLAMADGAQASGDNVTSASTPSSLAPGVRRGRSGQGSSGFSMRSMDLGDIGLTVGVALASVLAMLIAVSDAFAARCRNLLGRLFQTNGSKSGP
jgi:hypothetical protein